MTNLVAHDNTSYRGKYSVSRQTDLGCDLGSAFSYFVNLGQAVASLGSSVSAFKRQQGQIIPISLVVWGLKEITFVKFLAYNNPVAVIFTFLSLLWLSGIFPGS